MYRFLILCLLVVISGCASVNTSPLDRVISDRVSADGFYDKNQCEMALPLYQKINKTLNGDVHSLLRSGNCYAFQGDLKLAAEQYAEAIKLDPNFAKAWHNLVLVQARELVNTSVELTRRLPADSPVAEQAIILSEKMITILNNQPDALDIKRNND